MAYTPTQEDLTYMTPKKKYADVVSNALAQQNSSNGFNVLSNPTNNQQPTYQYQQGSAQGPLNYNDTKTAQSTGTAYISPAQRVNEALSATGGKTNTTFGSGNTSNTPSAGDIYKQQNEKSVSDYKAGQIGTGQAAIDEAKANQAKIDAANVEAIKARVKAAVEKGVAEQQKIIDTTPQQFVNPMNQASFQGAKNARANDERFAAMGLGRSGTLATTQVSNQNQTAANINDLENTKQQIIANANQAIADLRAQGNLQEVQLVQEAAAQSLKDLQNQINLITDRSNRANEAIFNNATNFNNNLYNISKDEQTRTDNQYLQQGLVYDPKTGTYVKTSSQKEIDYKNDIAAKDKEKQDYINSIAGLGDQFDYQGEINKIANDGDTSNDWKIPYLKQERQKKVETKLQSDIGTISQYGNDYQAEINKRTAANPNDPLIPYLKVAQLQKLSTIASNKLTQQQQIQKNAFETWKQIGYATQEIASILGVPVGAKTMDYIKTQNDTAQTQYNISKPYYNPNVSEPKKSANEIKADLNKSMGEDYKQLKNMSVADASKTMTDNADAFIAEYGYNGYKQLWNSVMDAAIKAGQAETMK